VCHAPVLDHGAVRTELFVDPDNGHFAGERHTRLAAGPGDLPVGTATRTAAVLRFRTAEPALLATPA
jgi:hypothetical protein